MSKRNPQQKLILSLRDEFLGLQADIANARFGLAAYTLPKKDSDLLKKQIDSMTAYADVLLERIAAIASSVVE
jgi:hypothetical protein